MEIDDMWDDAEDNAMASRRVRVDSDEGREQFKPTVKALDAIAEWNTQPKSTGIKYDNGKIQYTLVPSYALEAVAKNLTAGLIKYKERDNWKKVPDATERYLEALYRHLEAHRRGEIYDTENDDPTTTHMSAVAVNAMFILEFMLNENLKEIKS